MRYQFIGHQETVFTGFLTELGTLVLAPGDVVEFPHEVDHPLLQPTKHKALCVAVAAGEPVVPAGVLAGDDASDDPAPAGEDPKE